MLSTLEQKPFLVANGVQTLSYEYLNLAQEIPDLKAAGVTRYRLSPHSCDMVQVATTFRSVLDGAMAVAEAVARLEQLPLDAPFANGFHHGRPGHGWTALTSATPHFEPANRSTPTQDFSATGKCIYLIGRDLSRILFQSQPKIRNLSNIL